MGRGDGIWGYAGSRNYGTRFAIQDPILLLKSSYICALQLTSKSKVTRNQFIIEIVSIKKLYLSFIFRQ